MCGRSGGAMNFPDAPLPLPECLSPTACSLLSCLLATPHLEIHACEARVGNCRAASSMVTARMCVGRYDAAKTILASDYKMDDEQKEQCKAIKVVLFTNMAMVHAKAGADDKVLPARAFCLNAAADCLIIALYLPYNCLIIAL